MQSARLIIYHQLSETLKKKAVKMSIELMNPVISEIKNILDLSRQNVARTVNNELLGKSAKLLYVMSRMTIFVQSTANRP